jgi:hypothetical protein
MSGNELDFTPLGKKVKKLEEAHSGATLPTLQTN